MVYNGSFEVMTSCPSSYFQIDSAVGWFQPFITFSSTELFSTCATHPDIKVPKNIVGFQKPLTDSSYAGIGVFVDVGIGNEEPREYIETKLLDTLKKGYTYLVEFYVSLSDSSTHAISNMGAYLTNDSLRYLNGCISPCLYNIKPQIQNDSLNILSDTANWVKVSGSFVAEGGEQFLTIGNFYNNASTLRNSILIRNASYSYSYYYVDDVKLIVIDSPLVEEPQDTTFVFIPNVFSPNQDGENDLWEVTASKVNSLNIQVFNRWGEQVYIFNSQNLQQDTSTTLSVTYNPAWDGYTSTGKPVPEGTYFYIIQYTLPSGETKVEKGHLTLIR